MQGQGQIDGRSQVVVLLDPEHADIADRRSKPVEGQRQLLNGELTPHDVDRVVAEIDTALLPVEPALAQEASDIVLGVLPGRCRVVEFAPS